MNRNSERNRPTPLAQGAAWRVPTVAYTVMRKIEFPRELKYGRGMLMSYTVEAMDEAVTVPAGSYALSLYQDENGKLKRLLAEAMLDNTALKDLLSKKW